MPSRVKMASPPPIIYQPRRIQLKSTNNIQRVRKEFQSDYLNLPFYPSDATLCHLTKLTYEDDLHKIQEQAGDWKILLTGEDVESGYFGILFWHEENQHLVIAHRGSKNVKTFVSDLRDIVNGGLVNEVHCACTFAVLALEKFNCSSVSITGHSVGGWLAQLTAFALEFLTVEQDKFCKKDKNNCHPHVVSFGSPGCYEGMVKVSKYFIGEKDEGFVSAMDVTNYFISPNIVNACSEQTGRIVSFDMNRSHYENAPEFFRILKSVSYVGNVTEYLDLHYYTTAFDYLHDVRRYEVKNWPLELKYRTSVEVLHSATKEELNFHFKFHEEENGNFDQRINSIVHHEYSFNKIEKYDGKAIWRNLFTAEEFSFLKNWKRMRNWNATPKRIVQLFSKKSLGDCGPFLPDFEIVGESCKCDDGERLINRTKWLFGFFPEAHEMMKKDISSAPEIFKTMFESAMDKYFENNPKYCVDFKDTVGLGNFFSDPEENVLMLAAENVKDEAYRVYSILKKISRNFCFASLESILDMKKYLDFESVMECSSTNDNLMVVVCDENKIGDLANHKILRKYKKKVVFIVPDEKQTKNKIRLADLTQDSLNFWANQPIVSLNGNNFALKDFDGVESHIPFEALKNYLLTQNKIMRIDFENDDLNRIFFNLSTLSIMKNIQIGNLMHLTYNYEENLKKILQTSFYDLLFFVTGVSENERQLFPDGNFILNPSKDPDESFEIFYDLCMKNSEKTILRFHLQENLSVKCLQIFDTKFVPPPKFHSQIILNKQKVLQSFDDYFFLIPHCYIFVLEKKYYFTRNSNGWCNGRFKFLPSFHVGLINFTKMLSDGQKLFQEKCKTYPSVLLVVVDKDGRFILENFHGSVKNIRDLVVINKNVALSQEEFLKKNKKKVTIITEKRKSTLLWKLAREMQNSWVFWIDLRDAQKHFRNCFSVNLDEMIKFLLSVGNVTPSDLVEIFLKKSLTKENLIPVRVFFDGFNESILEILKFLKDETTAEIWINATEFNREQLEDELNAFAVEVKNLEEMDGIKICRKVWLTKTCFDKIDLDSQKEKELNGHAVKLVEVSNSLFDKENNFFAIKIMSEIFEFGDFEKLNSHDLYSKYVDMKLDEYFEEKKCYFHVPTAHVYWLRKLIRDQLKNLGWNYVFNSEIKLKPEEISEISRINLVKINEGKIYFTDETLGDYFAALFFAERNSDVIPWEIFSKSEFKGIRSFLNDIFARENTPSAILKSYSKSLVDSFNVEILHQYAAEGNAKLIQMILEYFTLEPKKLLKKYINYQNSDGKTALHIAIEAEKPQVASLLLDFGACANIEDNEHRLPVGVSTGKREANYFFFKLLKFVGNFYPSPIACSMMAKSLMQADEENWDLFFKIVDFIDDGLKTTILQWAIHKNNMDAALRICENGGKLEEDYDEYCLCNLILLISEYQNFKDFQDVFRKVLYNFVWMQGYGNFKADDVIKNLLFAAKFDIWRLIQILIMSGADLNLKNRKNQTILHFACAEGRLDITELIVKKNGDLNVADCRSATPISLAAENDHWDIVKFLLEKVNINHPGPNGENILHIACRKNKVDIIPELIPKVNVNATDELGNTPVFLAAVKKNWDAALKLICSSNLNIRGQNGQSVLHLAVEDNDLPMIIKLIEHGADVNVRDNFDTTPIFLAVQCKHWEMVPELMKRNADPKISDHRNVTVLHLACHYNEPEMAFLMIENGLDVNAVDFSLRTPIHFAAEDGHWDLVFGLLEKVQNVNTNNILYFACRDNKQDLALKLIHEGSDINAEVFKETPIFAAAKNNHWQLVSKLLEFETVNVNVPDGNGKTVLHLAAKHNQLEVATRLADKGACINCKSSSGKTPLHAAAEKGHWDMVLELLRHPNAENVDGTSVLYLACRDGAEEVALMLMDDYYPNDSETSPISIAAENGRWNLVAKLKGDIHRQNSNGETVLHFACRDNQPNFVLNFTPCQVFKFADKDGKIPLFVAAEHRHWDLVLKLLDYSTVYDVKKVVKGQTILHLAAESGRWDVSRKVLEMSANEKIMLDYVDYLIQKIVFDKNAVDGEGRTSLLVAAENGHWDFVKELVKFNADVTIPNKKNETLLHFACRDNEADLAKTLIEKGIDVNAPDGQNKTPVRVAAERGHWDLVISLLFLGGNGNIPDENGVTILDFSPRAGLEIASLWAKLREETRKSIKSTCLET